MKIVLATLNSKYIHSSLALRYLKAYVERDFPDLDLCEYTINDVTMNIVTDIYRRQPDVVAFSCYIWNIEETIQVIRVLKKVLPGVTIVLGGPEVSYDTGDWMARLPEVDFIVMGEGEETFHHLLTELAGAGKFHMVFGIAYRKLAEIRINPPRPKLDLANLASPYPDTDDLTQLRNRVVYYECSRGCPFSCSFCLSSIESGVRYFPIERVKEDLLRLINAGVKTIKFVDRTFNIHKSYAMEMFDFLIRNHRGTVFQFEITGDILKPDVVDYLAENAPKGVFRFEIGVQSTNDLTNSLVKRRQNFERLSRTVRRLKESGRIVQHLDLIAGLPEEDYTSFRKTFNDVFALRPEELQLGFLKMLRGTGVRIDAEKYGYVYMDHAPYEILQNDVLSFEDCIRIKRVEDVLEKYWNDHRMDHTVSYLIEQVFASPFDFFQAFGDYWERHGWSRIGHQLDDLFLRLREFLAGGVCLEAERLRVVEGLMKADYLLNFRQKPRRTWWPFGMEKGEAQDLLKQLAASPLLLGEQFANLNLNEGLLHKHTMIEKVPAVAACLLKQKPVEADALLLVFYPPGAQAAPQLFVESLSSFAMPQVRSV
jgi:radical SAM superfamily enzyme YgiQ (UPF0313 family)